MKKTVVPIVALCVAALGTTVALAGFAPQPAFESHTYEIRIRNLTTGQPFSGPVFVTHTSAMHLFEPGKRASLGIQRIAEEGNVGPTVVMALMAKKQGKIGAVETGLPIEPGTTGTYRISADSDHPLVSGAWMLGHTNDGFTGIDGVDAMAMGEERTMTLVGWDAGSEKNDERQTDMIALMGPNRNPENGVIHHHTGIRGDKDAPKAWKFGSPVARITIRRVD